MSRNSNMSRKRQGKSKSNYRRQQPKADSKDPRINLDNARDSKVARKFEDGDIFNKNGSAMHSKGSNDVKWYAKTPALLESAGRIAYSQTTGIPDGNGIIVPGVLVLPWYSSIGGFNSDPIKQAADSIYSFVVHQNSRNTSYSSADMMSVILAGKEIFNAIPNLIRAYGLMLQTNQENSYLPQALLRGCGFAYADLQSNYNRMLFDINQVIAEARQIWLPNMMPVIEREFWMSTRVYMDSESPKGQYFMYVPASLRIYDETTNPNGTQLVADDRWDPIGGMTWTTAIAVVRDAIKALMNSEYRGVIFGDILKAYGAESIFKIEFLDANYSITPEYDKEVMTQIENCTYVFRSGVRNKPSTYTTTINVNNGTGLISEIQPVLSSGTLDLQADRLYPNQPALNFHFKGQPTSADIMVATRMTAVGNAIIGDPVDVPTRIVGNMPRYCGTEVAVGAYIVQLTSTFTMTLISLYQQMSESDLSGASTSAGRLQAICATSAFDWAPWIYVVKQTGKTTTSAGDIDVVNYIADVDNYVVLQQSEVARMHRTAILSEFGVPVL